VPCFQEREWVQYQDDCKSSDADIRLQDFAANSTVNNPTRRVQYE